MGDRHLDNLMLRSSGARLLRMKGRVIRMRVRVRVTFRVRLRLGPRALKAKLSCKSRIAVRLPTPAGSRSG